MNRSVFRMALVLGILLACISSSSPVFGQADVTPEATGTPGACPVTMEAVQSRPDDGTIRIYFSVSCPDFPDVSNLNALSEAEQREAALEALRGMGPQMDILLEPTGAGEASCKIDTDDDWCDSDAFRDAVDVRNPMTALLVVDEGCSGRDPWREIEKEWLRNIEDRVESVFDEVIPLRSTDETGACADNEVFDFLAQAHYQAREERVNAHIILVSSQLDSREVTQAFRSAFGAEGASTRDSSVDLFVFRLGNRPTSSETTGFIERDLCRVNNPLPGPDNTCYWQILDISRNLANVLTPFTLQMQQRKANRTVVRYYYSLDLPNEKWVSGIVDLDKIEMYIAPRSNVTGILAVFGFLGLMVAGLLVVWLRQGHLMRQRSGPDTQPIRNGPESSIDVELETSGEPPTEPLERTASLKQEEIAFMLEAISPDVKLSHGDGKESTRQVSVPRFQLAPYLSVGRGQDNEVNIIVPTPEHSGVSRNHFSVTEREGKYYLKDMSSTHTRINGTTIPKKGEMLLEDQAEIELGDAKTNGVILRVHLPPMTIQSDAL